MPMVADEVQHSIQKSKLAEEETLCLPSDFTADQRSALGLVDLAADEVALREGGAFDAIRKVQSMAKALSALGSDKKKHARGQVLNTRAISKIRDLEAKRNEAIIEYNSARKALISLNQDKETTDARFPILSIHDTFRKSPIDKRQLGDTWRTGRAWRGSLHSEDTGKILARVIPSEDSSAATELQGTILLKLYPCSIFQRHRNTNHKAPEWPT
jgi:hypothetical protein